MSRLALFIPEPTDHGTVYHPANKAAVAVCSILGRRVISERFMPQVRELGYDARLANGEPIGRVDVLA